MTKLKYPLILLNMMGAANRITLTGLILNTFLFIIKLIAGIMSNSIAVISDALNSFTDIFSSIAVYISITASRKKADEGHPFGHHRAEPIAGIVIAIFAGIIGFEIIKGAIERLLDHQTASIGPFVFFVVIISIIIKIFMVHFFRKTGERLKSPAILASAVDFRNDILASSLVLIGVAGSYFGLGFIDEAVGILIGLWIIKSGYDIGKQNIDYLMGKSPDRDLINKIKRLAKNVNGVKGVNDIRAHYVGNYIHIEIHIEVDKRTSTLKSHAIGKDVARSVESIDEIDKAFIHIDPV